MPQIGSKQLDNLLLVVIISSLICMALVLIMCCKLLFRLYQLKRTQPPMDNTNILPFIFLFGMFFTAFVTCCTWIFVRMNIFIPVSTMGNTQCWIGWTFTWIFYVFAKLFGFLLYTYRLHVAFYETPFGYQKNKLFLFALFTTCSLTVPLLIVMAYFIFDEHNHAFELHVIFKNKFCCSTKVPLPIIITAPLTYATVVEIISWIVILYLFMRQLLKLKHILTIRHLEENGSVYLSNTTNNSIELCNGINNVNDATKQMIQSFNMTRSEISIRPQFASQTSSTNIYSSFSLKRIDNLTQLMLKMTILILITVSSTALTIFGGLIVDSVTLQPLDLIIQLSCSWLLFGINHKDWDIVVKILYYPLFCFLCCPGIKGVKYYE